MSISSTKDNVFSLQRSSSLNNINEHVYSLQRNTFASEDNARIFILQKDDALNSINERLFLLSRPSDVDVEISIDTRRNFHWRYENPGYKEKLITVTNGSCELSSEKSKTGVGFWNNSWMKAFDVRPTREFWARFDLYILSNSSFRIVDSTEWRNKTGFIVNTNAPFTSNAKGTSIVLNSEKEFPGIDAGFHQILVHFKSSVTNGIIQLWCDNEKTPLCERTGNVNN